jgi:transcriptional regulator with XRE-family HTH domain
MTSLAHALYVSRPNLALWETGRRRPVRALWPQLAAILHLEPADVGGLFADHPPARLDGQPLPSLSVVRRQRGMTQRALARLVGVAPTTLSMWENAGVRVALHMAEELARVLDSDVTELAADPRADGAADVRPLRRMRRALNMSQREAAAHLGIALGTLARYEAGERQPSVLVARRMAVVYRQPLDELFRSCGMELLPQLPGPRWSARDVPQGIRAARMRAGLTKVALGRAVGRSGQAVHGWETGRTRPSAATCRRLEKILRLPARTIPYEGTVSGG